MFIHPYDNPGIIAGQGTCAMELMEQVPDLDTVIAPVGGGGLLSGTALACRFLKPGIRVIGVEPKGADDAFRSLRDGRIHPSVNPRTVADGLRTSLGSLTFPIIRETVSAVLTVEEESILRAMRLIWERMKIIVEPSAAVPLGTLLEWQHAGSQSIGGRLSPDSRIGIILSGGNLDLDRLPWSG